jgi:hypothetical protein
MKEGGMEQETTRKRRNARGRAPQRPDLYVEVRLVSESSGRALHDDAPGAEPRREPEPSAEPELAADRILADGERRRLDRRAQHLSEHEAALGTRASELDRRDEELARREAELEAAFGIREDRIEQREGELAEFELRLERREQELTTYVTRLQAEISRRG